MDFGVGQGATRSADIRSDLGQVSNAGQRQNQRNRGRCEAEGQLAASLTRYSPTYGDAPRSLLAISPSASTRGLLQYFNNLLGGFALIFFCPSFAGFEHPDSFVAIRQTNCEG